MHDSDARLKAEVAAAGGDPEDAPLVEEVERRHAAFEAAQERLEYVRHHGIFVGGACVAAAVPAVAAVRTSELDELLAAERDAAVPAVAGADVHLGFIKKFHVR